MTQTVNPVDSGLEPVMAEPAPRRRLIARFSLGHLVMILAGLLAFLLALAVLRDNSVTTFVATAANDIAAGTTISASDIELVEVTGNALADSVLDADAVNQIIIDGLVTSRAIAAGTLLQPTDFLAAGGAVDIRSMSIPISPARAVAGSLKGGDLVDVIASDDEGSWYVTTGAQVLAVASAETGGFSSNDYTITIAVDAVVGLRLACAMENFTIDVVRSTGAPAIGGAPIASLCE